MRRLAALALALLVPLASGGSSRVHAAPGPALRVAVFEIGEPAVRTHISAALRTAGFLVLDPTMVDAAGRGAGYDGSLNLTLTDSRRLAQIAGASVLVLGTLVIGERESDNGHVSVEAFSGLFLVDGPSGRLLRYCGLRASGTTRTAALDDLKGPIGKEVCGWTSIVAEAERGRASGSDRPNWEPAAVDLLETPEGGSGLAPPRFFKRPAPQYTDDAERAHAVATVDLVVQFNADGSYGPIEVVRWAGFGLDEAAVTAVRGREFWPARRDGRPVTARALLRYNFRFRDR